MASRLPSAVSYIATVAVTFFLAHELLGASAAPLAALVLATSAGPLLYGRSLFTDTLFGLWLAVSFLGLVLTVRGRRGLLGPLLFWSGLSLAGLTKGLVGIVLPLGTASTCWLLFGRKRLPHDLRPLLGAAIVSLVLVPWHLLLPGPRRDRRSVLATRDRRSTRAGRRPRRRVDRARHRCRARSVARCFPGEHRGVPDLAHHAARRCLSRLPRRSSRRVVRRGRAMPEAHPPLRSVHPSLRRRGPARVAPLSRASGIHDLGARGGRARVVRRARPSPGSSGSLAA